MSGSPMPTGTRQDCDTRRQGGTRAARAAMRRRVAALAMRSWASSAGTALLYRCGGAIFSLRFSHRRPRVGHLIPPRGFGRTRAAECVFGVPNSPLSRHGATGALFRDIAKGDRSLHLIFGAAARA